MPKKRKAVSYLTKQRSNTRYSKERAAHKNLTSFFAQFLDKRRVEYAAGTFYAMCKLEVTHGDKIFTINEFSEFFIFEKMLNLEKSILPLKYILKKSSLSSLIFQSAFRLERNQSVMAPGRND